MNCKKTLFYNKKNVRLNEYKTMRAKSCIRVNNSRYVNTVQL